MKTRLVQLYSLFSQKTRIQFFLIILLMLIGTFFELLGIGSILMFLITFSEPTKLLDWPILGELYAIYNIRDPKVIFQVTAIGLISIFLFKNGYLAGLGYIKSKFVQLRRLELSEKLFRKYMRAPFVFHLNNNSTELLRNTCVEVRILCLEALSGLMGLILSSIMIIGIVVCLIIIEPLASLFILGTLGILTLLFIKTIKRRVGEFGEEEQKQRKVEYRSVTEGLGGVAEAKVFGVESYFINNFVNSTRRTAKSQMFKTTLSQANTPVMETLAVSGLLLLILFFQNTGADLNDIVPKLGLFSVAILKLQSNVSSLTNNYSLLKYNLYAVDPVYKSFNELSFVESGSGLKMKDEQHKLDFEHQIHLKNISYTYPGTSQKVLKDINLTVQKNGSVGFVGATGSGKTTLINIILGLLTPETGDVYVDRKAIIDSSAKWQGMVGFIPQHIFLSDQTIKKNVAFGVEEELINIEQLEQALKVAHIYDFVSELDKGWDTVVGERGVRLSGGQRQRLGIARAVYHDPEILIMDEATSSLDTVTEANVMAALKEAGKSRTKLIIAHRLKTVKDCDIIHYMKNGTLISSGPYYELIQKNEEFREMTSTNIF